MVTMLSAQQLIDGQYYQISRQYKTLARLPKGKTGTQALLACLPVGERRSHWADELKDGDHYLRVYAGQDDRVQVDLVTFRHYRSLGGGTYPEVLAARGVAK